MNSRSGQTIVAPKAGPVQVDLLKKTKLFRNKNIALQIEFPKQTISPEKILNLINYSHFFNQKFLLHLRCSRDETDYLVEVVPEPATSEEINCRWQYLFPHGEMEDYKIRNVIINKDNALVIVPAVMTNSSGGHVSIRLSDKGALIGQRQMRRYPCRDIGVEIRHGESVMYGELMDFNSQYFRIRIRPEFQINLSEISRDSDLLITMSRQNTVYFSGRCRIFRAYLKKTDWDIVCTTAKKTESDPERASRIRNPRLKLCPRPVAVFRHPFLHNRVEREIEDLSNSGCSIREGADESVLTPGMLIPELTVRYAGALDIDCKAKVLYRRQAERHDLVGVAFIDMDLANYTALTNLTHNHLEPNAFISKKVDLEALWEFLFDTGFIYPKKYHLIGAAREEFKKTYERLYENCPDLARHFTYEKDGRLYGHIAMIKAYSRTWLSHHLAARPMEGKIIGLEALKQIIHFLHSLSKLPSMRTDYVAAYYQPKNSFADRVYGNFARDLKNRKACSLDLFAYKSFEVNGRRELPEGFSLKASTEPDLVHFEKFYEGASGGLLLDAMGIKQRGTIDGPLRELYFKFGFRRNCLTFSLKYKSEPVAILIAEESNVGMNLSEVLNGIKLFVLNPDVSWNAIDAAVNQIAARYRCPEITLLSYPDTYLKTQGIQDYKFYQFWILNLKEFDREYTDYMSRKFRIRFQTETK